MENKHVVVATFASLTRASEVRSQLLDAGFDRGDIGVAVHKETDKAMLSVTVAQEDSARVKEILTKGKPEVINERNVQWRLEDDWQQYEPDADEFTAVDRAE